MPRGGARTRSGPAPDPNALYRERDAGEWTTLPECREGDPPVWPLVGMSMREKQLWDELWTMPQAVMWERQRQFLEVGLYVRRFCEAEQPESPTTLSTLVRQMADSLGLTTPGMRSHKWKIAAAAPDGDKAPVPAARQSARDRLTVISGDGGA